MRMTQKKKKHRLTHVFPPVDANIPNQKAISTNNVLKSLVLADEPLVSCRGNLSSSCGHNLSSLKKKCQKEGLYSSLSVEEKDLMLNVTHY